MFNLAIDSKGCAASPMCDNGADAPVTVGRLNERESYFGR
jgi:hypothetical protein